MAEEEEKVNEGELEQRGKLGREISQRSEQGNRQVEER